jgi:UPF0755 protein
VRKRENIEVSEPHTPAVDRKKPAGRRTVLRVLIFLILVLLTGSLSGVFGLYYLNLPGPADRSVTFTVNPGESSTSVGHRLTVLGFVRHPIVFRIIALSDRSTVKTGSYLLEPGMTALEIHELLVSGKQMLTRVTIPEGWTISKIAARLAEAGICDADEFNAAATDRGILDEHGIPGRSAEGYLHPDTYLFPSRYPADKVVSHMVSTFFERLGELFPEYETLDMEELYDKVTLASIIEREYRIPDEAPLMASVFYNRLKRPMYLGSCATVEYIITELLGRPHPEYLTTRDIEIESEYNTYIHLGLPPGPISNPGRTALEAVFFPARTDYLYFVLQDGSTGKHYFSRSLNEHNSAKRVYLKGY